MKNNKVSLQNEEKTVLALWIGLKLNLEESNDLLERAGYALSPSSKFDLFVKIQL